VTQHDLAKTAIRGTIRGFWRFRPLAPKVCEITYVNQVHLKGSIPKELLALRKKQALGLVYKIQSKYERNGAVVDAEMRAAFPSPPPLTGLDDEQRAIVDCCRAMESGEEGTWVPLLSLSPFIDMRCKHSPARRGERSIALGMATALVDSSARDALASWWSYASRKNMRISSEQSHPARLVQRRNGLNDAVVATIKKMPFPLNNREFVNRQLCCSDVNGDLLFAYAPVDDVIDYGMNARAVRGLIRAIMRLTPTGESQCKVTYHIYINANGRIPTFVVNAKIPITLGAVGGLREEFQRDDEIDKLERDELARTIKEEPRTYTADEDTHVNKVDVKLGMIEWEFFKELESPDFLVKMGKIYTEGSSLVVGRAIVTVDAEAELCAAWDMSVMSRERVKIAGSLRGSERSLTRTNGFNGLFRMVMDLEIPGLETREVRRASGAKQREQCGKI